MIGISISELSYQALDKIQMTDFNYNNPKRNDKYIHQLIDSIIQNVRKSAKKDIDISAAKLMSALKDAAKRIYEGDPSNDGDDYWASESYYVKPNKENNDALLAKLERAILILVENGAHIVWDNSYAKYLSLNFGKKIQASNERFQNPSHAGIAKSAAAAPMVFASKPIGAASSSSASSASSFCPSSSSSVKNLSLNFDKKIEASQARFQQSSHAGIAKSAAAAPMVFASRPIGAASSSSCTPVAAVVKRLPLLNALAAMQMAAFNESSNIDQLVELFSKVEEELGKLNVPCAHGGGPRI